MWERRMLEGLSCVVGTGGDMLGWMLEVGVCVLLSGEMGSSGGEFGLVSFTVQLGSKLDCGLSGL